MKVQLVSHASVIVESADTRIWSDPWLQGKAFNESWTLFPPAAWDARWLDRIDYLWISHEHPDHFHIPTLKTLPAAFKERVTVLFQQNNSDKMFHAFGKLGFRRHRALPHRETVSLTPRTAVYCHQEGQMNSCLAVRSDGKNVLNVNDAEIRTPDCRIIHRDIGSCDVVLNQFSIAGYSGFQEHDEHLPQQAAAILRNVVDNHRDLGARVTIPFASFVYFSAADNRFINNYANRPANVVAALHAEGFEAAVLYPGDTFDTESVHDSAEALGRYEEVFRRFDELPFDPPQRVEMETIAKAFQDLAGHLKGKYPSIVLGMLQPFTVRIPDLELTVRFEIRSGEWRRVEPESTPDLVINSQPLYFAFAFPYGVQTLGVSARYALVRNYRNWQLHRILFSMNNAEVYLRPRYFFTARNLAYLRKRFWGGTGQLVRRIQTMKMS